ncbi:RNA polymerase sigma factor [Flindersiella endophytica]
MTEGLELQFEAVRPGSYTSKTVIKNVDDTMPMAIIEASLVRAVELATLIKRSSIGASVDDTFVRRVDWQDADDVGWRVRGRERPAAMTSTAELVEAVAEGDRAAFAELYREFVSVVRLAVWDQLRDADQVAAVVQETFARALRALPKLRDPNRFRQWLLAIARHTAVDARRDQSRLVPADPDDAEPLSWSEDSAELAALRDVAAMVEGMVGGLSRQDAVALRLVTLGFDVSDVARALGVGNEAARVLLHRARSRLRSALVLQLLSSGPTTACSQLTEILDHQGIAAAGRHAETCETCSTAARKIVYGEGPR